MTRRGRLVAVILVTAVVLAGAVVAYRTMVGGTACDVTGAGTTVHLGRETAEKAATAAAGVRKIDAASKAITRATDLSGDDARAVATALTGNLPAALTCRGGGADSAEPDRLDAAGLTRRAVTVRADIAARFGDLPLGGFAPGGVTTGHMPGSAHYEGRAIDVFFRPVTKANQERGWALAQYLVANAERLKVDTVIFDARIWTARRSFQGWRDYRVDRGKRSAETIAILEHRDHVHVDVAD